MLGDDDIFENVQKKQYLKLDKKEYEVSVGSYPNSKAAMSITINEKNFDNFEDKTILTVDLGNHESEKDLINYATSFIDVNEQGINAEEFLQRTGIAAPRKNKEGMTLAKSQDYRTYPLYRFSTSRLKQLDPKGFEEYERNHKEEYEKEKQSQSQSRDRDTVNRDDEPIK